MQRFGEDILALPAMFAITVTGLPLWVSYTRLHGYAYEFLAILHAITVIFTLLWLPFGKLFHIFQRPARRSTRMPGDGRAGTGPGVPRMGMAWQWAWRQIQPRSGGGLE